MSSLHKKRDLFILAPLMLMGIWEPFSPRLSSLRWLQKGLLSRIKNTKKKYEKIQLKNTKSDLQGLENTAGWLGIYFAIWF